MELICIDDSRPPDPLNLFQEFVIETKFYTVREVIKLPNGQTGLLLHEIENKVCKHDSGLGTFEPSFNSKRFTTLLGETLTAEKIKELKSLSKN